MERYKFSQVPNRKKLSHFFTYYSWQTAGILFAAVIVGYLLYLAVLAPKTDVSILWVSSTYSLESDALVSKRLKELDWDHNGDGKCTVMLQHAEFGESFEKTDADSQIALMTVLGAADTDILFVSQAALDWGNQMGLFGTYSDLGGWENCPQEDIAVFPCKNLAFFSETGIDAYEPMYLVIAKPRGEPERDSLYRKNLESLRTLLTWEG